MCVFCYGGVVVRKDVPPKDAHASKPVLSVGLDVCLPARIFLVLDPHQLRHRTTVKWSQDDQNLRWVYNLELVDDIDDTGTESDREQDMSTSLFEPDNN